MGVNGRMKREKKGGGQERDSMREVRTRADE